MLFNIPQVGDGWVNLTKVVGAFATEIDLIQLRVVE